MATAHLVSPLDISGVIKGVTRSQVELAFREKQQRSRDSTWHEPRPRWTPDGIEFVPVPTISVRRDVDLPVTPAFGWSTTAPAHRQRTVVQSLVRKGMLAGGRARPGSAPPAKGMFTSPRVITPRGARVAGGRGTDEELAIVAQEAAVQPRPQQRPSSAGKLQLGRPQSTTPGRELKPTLDTRNDAALRRQPKWSDAAREQWQSSQAEAELEMKGARWQARQQRTESSSTRVKHARAKLKREEMEVEAKRRREVSLHRQGNGQPIWGKSKMPREAPAMPGFKVSPRDDQAEKMLSPAEHRQESAVSSGAQGWGTGEDSSGTKVFSTSGVSVGMHTKKRVGEAGVTKNLWEAQQPELQPEPELRKKSPKRKQTRGVRFSRSPSPKVEPEPEPEREPEPEPEPEVGPAGPIDLPAPSAVAANVLELAEWRRVGAEGRVGIAGALSSSAEDLDANGSISGMVAPDRPGISVSVSSHSLGGSLSRSYDHLPGGFEQHREQVEEKAHRQRFRAVEAEALNMLEGSEWEIAVSQHLNDGATRLESLQERLQRVGEQLHACIGAQKTIQHSYEEAMSATEAKQAAVDAMGVFVSQRYANREGTGLNIKRSTKVTRPAKGSALGSDVAMTAAYSAEIAQAAMGNVSARAKEAKQRMKDQEAERERLAAEKILRLSTFATQAFAQADGAVLRADREEIAIQLVEEKANTAAKAAGRGMLAHHSL